MQLLAAARTDTGDRGLRVTRQLGYQHPPTLIGALEFGPEKNTVSGYRPLRETLDAAYGSAAGCAARLRLAVGAS